MSFQFGSRKRGHYDDDGYDQFVDNFFFGKKKPPASPENGATISNPNSAQEKQADQLAGQVARGENVSLSNAVSSSIAIQAKSEGQENAQASPEFMAKLSASKNRGETLPESTRTQMESRMGEDFSGVKVHTDQTADTLSKDINAKAFTHGQDIYFKQGQYDPQSQGGKDLLAHELVHTRQQGDAIFRQQEDQDETQVSIGNEDPAEVALGQKLLTEYPDGVHMMIYDHISTALTPGGVEYHSFTSGSQRWAKDNNAVGINNNKFTASEIGFGIATPYIIEVDEKSDYGDTTIIEVAEIINRTCAVLKNAVKKAEEQNQQTNAETFVPNENAYKVKVLAFGSHGSCFSGSNISAGVSSDNVATIFTSISPNLTADVNVIYYACSVAKDEDEEYNQWLKVYNEPGGETSLAAQTRDTLADLGHGEARVWSHTASGHFMDNYTLRFFDASQKGQEGTSYLMYVFAPQINALNNEVVNILRSQDYVIMSETDLAWVNSNTYQESKESFRKAYAGAMTNKKTDIDPSDKTTERNMAEIAPLKPDEIAAEIQSYYNTEFAGPKPDASKIATTLQTKKDNPLQKIPAASTIDVPTMTMNMRTKLLDLPTEEKNKIPDQVALFSPLAKETAPQTLDASFYILLKAYQEGMNIAKGQPIYVVGEFNQLFIDAHK